MTDTAEPGWRSSLEIYDLARGTVRVLLRSAALIEAPNWHPDGWLMVNGAGRLSRVPLAAPALLPIDTGDCDRCNNDHGFLPDGRIVLTHHTGAGAAIYALREGEAPEVLVGTRPSWWHGAAGGRIVYAAARDGRRVVGLCEMDLATGQERRLTPVNSGLDGSHCDGPDYSACGGFIWFNCDVTGQAQIWRMPRDGGTAVQVFADDRVNWFPHPSPCGRSVLYLSYPPGTEGHPRDLDVQLCLMDLQGGNRRVVVELFGGQGSINVPCWAPDGSAFAFMRYAPGT